MKDHADDYTIGFAVMAFMWLSGYAFGATKEYAKKARRYDRAQRRIRKGIKHLR